MHRLRNKTEAEGGGLLRVLFLRHRALPAYTGRPLGRAGGGFLLCVARLLDGCGLPDANANLRGQNPGRMMPARNKNGL
jgi:hypothetical protein